MEIIVEGRDAAQIIRFNRPEKKNALKSDMYAAVRAALIEGDANPAIAAHIFIGTNGTFTAGSDISEFAKRADGDIALGGDVQALIRHLPHVTKPMIAAVDGLAVGIGTTLLFHCDLAYATETATFRTPFLDLGLVPEAGSSLIAPHLMGHARAFEMLVLGNVFNAERALNAGLINNIVETAALEETALTAANRLAEKPPEALAAARKLLRGNPVEIAERIDEEIAIFADRLKSPEAREAFAAFFEKRPPRFKSG